MSESQPRELTIFDKTPSMCIYTKTSSSTLAWLARFPVQVWDRPHHLQHITHHFLWRQHETWWEDILKAPSRNQQVLVGMIAELKVQGAILPPGSQVMTWINMDNLVPVPPMSEGGKWAWPLRASHLWFYGALSPAETVRNEAADWWLVDQGDTWHQLWSITWALWEPWSSLVLKGAAGP